MIFLVCLIGVITGLRTMTAFAAVSLAAYLGLLHLDGTALAFLGHSSTLYIFIFLAIIELIVDQLPSTPSRKAPLGFTARIVIGALCGAAISTAGGNALWSVGGLIGSIVGIIGAVIGTLGGAEVRARLANAFGKDRPAALIEDLVAILGAALILMVISQLK